MCQCNKVKCGCVRTISKTGKQGKNGRNGKDGKDGKDGTLIETRFDFTPAQVKAAHSTPVVMLPAPGVGKGIAVDSARVRREFVTAGYTSTGVLITSAPTSAAQAATSGNFLSVAAGSFPGKTSIQVNMMHDFNVALNIYENTPLYFEVGSADSVTGDDLITVWISYRIVTF